METYVRRTYGQKKTIGEHRTFPFWDYRSRRGSLSTSASSSDGSSVSSMGSSRSDIESESVSISSSDSDSPQNDPTKLTVQFYVDPHEMLPLLNLYQPIVSWIDADLHIFNITEGDVTSLRHEEPLDGAPSLGIIVFLHEEGMLGCERIQDARRHFDRSPWRFHHSENLCRRKINPYPYNSQEFYYTSHDLPLWAVRQVHYGKEHIRLVVYTSNDNWEHMLEFYKLILGTEPELLRSDFCMFTVHSHVHYNIQFALKRLPEGSIPQILTSVTLQFKVTDMGHIVPLFPNICQPIDDNRWKTTDHDGNSIILEVVETTHMSSLEKCFSRLAALDSSMDRSSSEEMSLSSASTSSLCSSSTCTPEEAVIKSSFNSESEYNSGRNLSNRQLNNNNLEQSVNVSHSDSWKGRKQQVDPNTVFNSYSDRCEHTSMTSFGHVNLKPPVPPKPKVTSGFYV